MDYNQLHSEQKQAFILALRHLINKEFSSKYMVLNGFGGSGKTAVIKSIMGLVDKSCSVSGTVVAFTGRAASHLSKDGIAAQTCHSLMYTPVLDSEGNLIKFDKRNAREIVDDAGDFIIVDEASMIPKDIHEILDSLGIQILYVGDDDQLEPVDRDNPDFSVMASLNCPVFTLTVNHRQDKDSGIERICSHLRETNSIKRINAPDLRFIPKSSITKQFFESNQYDMVICGTNRMRKKINGLIRAAKGFDPAYLPQEGETIVCLRNTIISEVKLNNGEIFKVDGAIYGDHVSKYFISSVDTDRSLTVNIQNDCWESEYSPSKLSDGTALASFTYGYCMSAFKCQGSTIEKVMVIDENVGFFLNQRKFRYTAVSRASQHLTVVI